MTPKLYQYAACPFCNKVRSILKYKGIDFETVEVHPLNKKEIAFSEQYRAVPIYIDSQGNQVNDSTPIMRYIDQEFAQKPVFRTLTAEVEHENKWLAWSDAFVKGLPAVIYDSLPRSLSAFNYITKVGKFSWFEKRMIKYSGALIMTMVAKKIKKRENINDPELFLNQKAKEWAVGLNDRPFMGGDQPNGADLAVYGIFQSIANLPAAKIMRHNSIFDGWVEQMDNATKK